MHAIQIKHPGGPDVMQWTELPTPSPGRGEVLVRIEAAGVNFIDVYLRKGAYSMPLPGTPGGEGAGVVEALGPEVTVWPSRIVPERPHLVAATQRIRWYPPTGWWPFPRRSTPTPRPPSCCR